MPFSATGSSGAALALLVLSCAVRISAPGDRDLSGELAAQPGASAILEVDLDVDWIVLEGPEFSRRIVVKPAHGTLLLRGLPPGKYYARTGEWLPCWGYLQPGKVTFLDENSTEEIWVVNNDPLMGRDPDAGRACAFYDTDIRTRHGLFLSGDLDRDSEHP